VDFEGDLSGILIVDKQKGMTSHDVVDMVRKRFSVKKVGHAGTLDPNATGVLVLLVGKATKLSSSFLEEDKEYFATMKLGERTDSGDCDGSVISSGEVLSSEGEIRDVIAEFLGEIEQVPPMFSAKKINGKKLYKLARKGKTIERKPNKITIKKIDEIRITLPFVKFNMVCSKGTYVRQLVDDIGESLGCGANLTELRRTRSGEFSVEGAVGIDDLLKMDKKVFYENLIRI